MPTDRSHPPSAAAGADTRRITPGALLQRALTTEGGEANRALLVVALNRSDRLAALAQQQSARYVLGEVARRVETILGYSSGAIPTLLTGQYPRDFAPKSDPIAVVLRGGAVPMRDSDPSVPEPLAAIIDQALADSPERRPASAREMVTALRNVL